MTYQALARKYRPQTFADILGQDSIVRTLENSIEQNRIHQAYLFSGVRGVGKTSAARIFAKALNCLHGPAKVPCNECSMCREITEGIDLDVREIDAATYTQVDNIRELREVTQFQPARDRNRIFIIDEAHMLSSGAWNALLKLIEEPPPHVVFMMATTEMHKVPQTILSRVQQFVFRRVTVDEVAERMAQICESEGIEASRDALETIARHGDGSVRDSISLLDQAVAFCGKSIRTADVATILGLSDNHFFAELVADLREGRHARILETLEDAAESGRDFKLLYRDLLAYLRNLLLIRAGANERLLQLEPSAVEQLREVAGGFEYSELVRMINLLIRDEELIYRSEQQRLGVEIALLKAATLPRLRAVEQVLSGGSGLPAAPGPAAREIPPAANRGPETRRSAPPSGEPERQSQPEISSDDQEPIGRKIAREVSKQRRIAGSYLELAKKVTSTDDGIVFHYDPSQSFVVDQLNEKDVADAIASAASSLLGRTVAVGFELESEGKRPPRDPGVKALDEDPVVQAFARHLGGEVVRKSR